MSEIVTALYTDGGVILKNPSTYGGTWAYVHLNGDGVVIRERSGVVLPARWQLEAITNNFSELLALTYALLPLPDGWSGTVYSDSQCSLGRLFWGYKKWKGIPDELREMAEANVKRLGAVEAILLDGHPTKAQLALGIGKRGNMVSAFNVRCDDLCTEQARRFMETVDKE